MFDNYRIKIQPSVRKGYLWSIYVHDPDYHYQHEVDEDGWRKAHDPSKFYGYLEGRAKTFTKAADAAASALLGLVRLAVKESLLNEFTAAAPTVEVTFG